MRRQIRLLPALGLIFLALVAGLIGGAAAGGTAGYWFGTREDNAAQTVSSASTQTTAPVTTPSTQTQTDVSTNSDIDGAVSKVNPAVVTIENQAASPIGGGVQTQGMGSGFIIDEAGHIVTNNHVVEGATNLNVIFTDGTKVPASLVGADVYQDVAVIKIDGPVPAVATFGDSSKLQPGQRVIAIGSALGEFRNTVTDGIVSAGARSLDTGEGYRLANLVQHDAPINPGNSGGPLIDTNGNVVGMNTAVVRGGYGQAGAEGLGFAIEGNTVKQFADEIIAHGKIERPFIGVSFRPVSQAIGRTTPASAAQPVVVVEVASGSPAATAGLKTGDTITAIEGVTLDSEHPFLNEVFKHRPGDTVTMTIQRGGSSQDVKVTLGQRP